MRFAFAAIAAVFVWGCASAAQEAAAVDHPPPAATAPACLMVVQGVVTDRDAFPRYVRALPPLYARFGGAYLVVSRAPETLEGAPPFESIVISRWPSCAAARAFWNSAEYRALAAMRRDWGRFDVIIAPEMADGATAASAVNP